MRSYKLLYALISTYEHLRALMSFHKYGAMAPIALMSANEFSRPHGTILITSHELS